MGYTTPLLVLLLTMDTWIEPTTLLKGPLMTIHLIDIGNTTTEWVTCYDDGTDVSGSLLTDTLPDWVDTRPFPSDDLVAISSVVPRHHPLLLQQGWTLLTHHDIPLPIALPHPERIGMDRLINAVGAYHRFEHACVVVDSGTATTLCVIGPDGTYQGGVIFPGLVSAARALASHTAQLPLIAPQILPPSWVGTDTESAMTIGLMRGHILSINGFIAHYRTLYPHLGVIGTGGGLTPLHSDLTLDAYHPHLWMDGMKVVLHRLSLYSNPYLK